MDANNKPIPVYSISLVPDNDKSYGNAFEGDLTYNLNLSWAYNTLNRPVFPTKGMYHRVSLDVAVPGSDVEYQKLSYDTQAFFPLGEKFILYLRQIRLR